MDNKPILFHRVHTTCIGKSKPIDCYEIFKEGGFKEILFIEVYEDKNSEELPEGYIKVNEKIEPMLYNGSTILNTIGVMVNASTKATTYTTRGMVGGKTIGATVPSGTKATTTWVCRHTHTQT